MVRSILITLAVIITVAGCSQEQNSANALKTTEHQISADVLTTFLDFETDTLAGPADIAFLDEETLAVFDNKLISILLYGTDGNLIKRFGKEGKGPGEFARPMGMRIAENSLFVLDMGTASIHEFSLDGEFQTTHSSEAGMMNFAQTELLSPDEYLVPVNGTQGSLLQYYSETDSSFYFGEARADPAEVFDIQEFKAQVKKGEIPDFIKNQLLVEADDSAFYVFLQTYSQLQKYDLNGNLIWEHGIDLPENQQIYDQFVERNANMGGAVVAFLTHAMEIQAAGNHIYILYNIPSEQEQVLVRIDKEGNSQTVYRIGYTDGKFNSFAVDENEQMLYVTDMSLARIYRTQLPE